MGDATRQTGEVNASAGSLAALGAESQFRGSGIGTTEQVLDIIAPAGKLGVVIDTPDDGAPVVHAVKDSSVIADQIQVGDKLIAVDDEDVRSMTAIKVSKLISKKSANPSRKLTIIRTSVLDEP
jgi:C-terminal processing protease CtpA/Prc